MKAIYYTSTSNLQVYMLCENVLATGTAVYLRGGRHYGSLRVIDGTVSTKWRRRIRSSWWESTVALPGLHLWVLKLTAWMSYSSPNFRPRRLRLSVAALTLASSPPCGTGATTIPQRTEGKPPVFGAKCLSGRNQAPKSVGTWCWSARVSGYRPTFSRATCITQKGR